MKTLSYLSNNLHTLQIECYAYACFNCRLRVWGNEVGLGYRIGTSMKCSYFCLFENTVNQIDGYINLQYSRKKRELYIIIQCVFIW